MKVGAILFFVYVMGGVLTVFCPVDFIDRETNTVKLLCFGVGWPVLLVVGIVVGLWRISKRLVVDARALFPSRRVLPDAPRCVTVEMLAADPEPEYQPGRWMGHDAD